MTKNSAGKKVNSRKTSGKNRKPGKKNKPVLTRRQKIGKFFTVAGITVLSLLVLLVGGVIIAYERIKLPDPNADFQSQTTFIYYNDSTTKMANLTIQNRIVIGYDEMPKSIKDAVVSAENRDFWTDPGISIPGMMRAAWRIGTGGEMQGGSTITQQYIKVLYLNSERTLTRKFKELLLAVKMNRQVPKEEILAGYLNTIYFGRGAYGIEAAARAYFNISASELSVPQSAVLASVINNPAIFEPSGGQENIDRLTERYKYVLNGMKEAGAISESDYSQYVQALPQFPQVPNSRRYEGPNGFIVKMVEQELADLGFTSSQINGGGLHVTTTIDKSVQDQIVTTATNYTKKLEAEATPAQTPGQLHIGIATTDTNTGGVLGIYGGPDFVKNSRNWATTPRMSASTFKAYALAAGLRNGLDLNTLLQGNTFTPPGDSEPVRNDSGRQYGQVTLLRATTSSINTAFVDLTLKMENGPKEVIKAANDAGVPTGAGWDENGRISLGTAEVSPLDNAIGFSTFANGGTYHKGHVVKKVTDSKNNVLYENKDNGQRRISPQVASEVNRAMRSVITSGTGRRVGSIGHEAAGKTGTAGVDGKTQSAWFVAYTRNVATSVMFVAGDEGTASLDPYASGAFYGGVYPAMVWLEVMETVLDGKEKVPFDEVKPEKQSNRRKTSQPEPTTEPSVSEPSETQPAETSSKPAVGPQNTQSEPQQPTSSSESSPAQSGNGGNKKSPEKQPTSTKTTSNATPSKPTTKTTP